MAVYCSNCEEKVGLNRYKIKGGWLCPACLKKCSGNINNGAIMTKTIEDVRFDMAIVEKKNNVLDTFQSTKDIFNFSIDEKQELIRVRDMQQGVLGPKFNFYVFSFNEILSYELIEDQEVVTKGGLGRAVVGGLAFGGVGAIVGGVTGSKKSKSMATSLILKITLDSIENPVVMVNYLIAPTAKNSIVYKGNYQAAQEAISLLEVIVKKIEQKNQAVNLNNDTKNSSADEILKFKNLLDMGVITQEEFDIKKKQLLGL